MDSLTIPDHNLIIFGFIQRQPDIGFKRETAVSNRKGKIPTGDWSFDDRRRRRTLRCRSCHFFSRSSLGRHWRTMEVLEFLNKKERRRKKSQSSLKFLLKEKWSALSQPNRTFIGQWAPETMPCKQYRLSFQINLKRRLKRLPEKRWFSH